MSASPTRRRLQQIARLSRRRDREEQRQFLVEGVRSVESAVLAGARLVEILVTAEAAADERLSLVLGQTSATVHRIPASAIDRLADTRSNQGVIAVAELRSVQLAELKPPIVVMDGVQDPGNVGAVMRTAAWFGVKGILAGPGTADPWSPKAVRASMGGIWGVDVANSDELADALRILRSEGLAIYGADPSGTPLASWQPRRDGVLVVGSEAHGLSEGAMAVLDEHVGIPGAGDARGVESLNAAVAAGILLHRWLG